MSSRTRVKVFYYSPLGSRSEELPTSSVRKAQDMVKPDSTETAKLYVHRPGMLPGRWEFTGYSKAPGRRRWTNAESVAD